MTTDTTGMSEKPARKLSIDIRLCKDCKATLFDRRDFEQDLLKEPPDLRAYRNLVQFERGIRSLLPRFQKLLTALQFVGPLCTSILDSLLPGPLIFSQRDP